MKCIATGIDNPDSNLGCYAMTPSDYSDFSGFFDKVIRDYHGDISGKKQHVTSWEVKGVYDVQKIGLENLSMRVRVGRNLIGTKLPGMMSQKDRIDFEKKMLPMFDKLISSYGGKVVSLSPNLGIDTPNPNLIDEDQYLSLVKDHIMFKDMTADPYLKSAGISNHWPYGRGCWYSDDKSKIIWFGEEDQLRIMCMDVGTDLIAAFNMLKELLTVMESMEDIKFAKDDNYGYVTSCPSNLGTAMRASVHIKCPLLTAEGSVDKVKIICSKLGLSVRGVGGEHTPIGKDGTVDLSPSSRLFVTEAQVIESLYNGIEELTSIEKKVFSFIHNVVEENEDKNTEERDDTNNVNYVLINDSSKNQSDEASEQRDNITLLKEKARMKKFSKRTLSQKALPDIKERLSISSQSPSELKISPSPILTIKNE